MRKLFLLVLILALFLFTRLYFLNSGIYFYEPDEWSWDAAAGSLHDGWVPKVVGRYLFDQLPLFEILAFLLSFIVKGTSTSPNFLDIRLVSVIASFFVATSLYLYLKKKVGEREGVLAAILFILVPVAVFYSRYGGREMLLILFSFLFYWSFELLRNNPNSSKRISTTGFLLGMAIYAKLTALIFLAIPGFYLLTATIKEVKFNNSGFNAFQIGLKFQKNWFPQVKANFLLMATAILMVALAFIPFLLIDKTFLKDRLFLVLFAHGSSSNFAKLTVLGTYVTKPVYWLGITTALLVVIGSYYVFKKGLKKWLDLVVFTTLILTFLVTNEARARYFALIIPFLVVFAALGMGYLLDLINQKTKKGSINWLVAILIFISILPGTWLALESTNHTVFEQATKILVAKQDGRPLFSSYWPPIIQYISELPTIRLTNRMEDATRDGHEYPKFSPLIATPPTEVIDSKEGAWVLIHAPVDPDEFSERKKAIEFVKDNFEPFATVTDNKPNFPETNKPVTLYLYDTATKR